MKTSHSGFDLENGVREWWEEERLGRVAGFGKRFVVRAAEWEKVSS